jgi:hypothetical protein
MPLKPEFQFNQSNMQDYIDCNRRFELRYIDRRRWPALKSEPVLEQERHMLQGHRFHQMAHQSILNIPADTSQLSVSDPELAQWWENFVHANLLSTLPEQHYPEHTLTSNLAGFRITAKYDLLAIDPGKCVVIMDWKTGRRPKPGKLRERLQSRLYPFLLVEAGKYLNGGIPIRPEQVQMIYWFTSFPDNPIVYEYDYGTYLADRAYLEGLILEICSHQSGQFMLADEERTCLFCVYRSLCNRGVKAGEWDAMGDEFDDETGTIIDLDFNQIGEIAF